VGGLKMKKIFLLSLIILVASLFLGYTINEAHAEGAVENILTVNGTGIVKVKPNIAYINIGVETFDKDAKVAQEKNTQIMNKVIDEIKKSGIKNEDIKTVQYNIYKNYEYAPMNDGRDRVEGFQVRNIVEVTIRNIDKTGEIIGTASKAGANNIYNIRLGVDDEEKYYHEALKLAMKNAEGKANAILQTFGAKASKPYSISESGYGAPMIYKDARDLDLAAEAAYPTIETGELDITANVMVQYKY